MAAFDLASLQTHWVDVAMLGWLLVSMLIGLARGLVFEAFSLAGWVVAYFGAQWAAPLLAPYLPLDSIAGKHVAALVCAFVAILFAWALAARVVRMLVHATPLRLPDRVLGAGFGVLRGLLVLLAVATVVGHTPAAAAGAWQRSQGAAWLNAALRGVKPLLPDDLSQHLPA